MNAYFSDELMNLCDEFESFVCNLYTSVESTNTGRKVISYSGYLAIRLVA
jgi:hypothetical protein